MQNFRNNFYCNIQIIRYSFCCCIFISAYNNTLYSLYRCYKNRASISVDRASDNAYYLGLIFTLFSLSVSLIKLAGSGRNPEEPVAVINLLSDFGIALFSTITGITCRIILQQLRNDPMDVENEAREELGVAVRQLKSSITTVTGSLNTLSEATRLSLTELNTKLLRFWKKPPMIMRRQ